MKTDLNDIVRRLGRGLSLGFFRYARPFLTFVFSLTFVYGLFTWYDYVYRSDWTEDEKRTYAADAFEDTVFREQRFRDVIDAASRRAELHGTDLPVERDIFLVRETER